MIADAQVSTEGDAALVEALDARPELVDLVHCFAFRFSFRFSLPSFRLR